MNEQHRRERFATLRARCSLYQHVVEGAMLQRLHGAARRVDGDVLEVEAALAGAAEQHGRLAELRPHVEPRGRDAVRHAPARDAVRDAQRRDAAALLRMLRHRRRGNGDNRRASGGGGGGGGPGAEGPVRC